MQSNESSAADRPPVLYHGAAWYVDAPGRRVWALRSRKGGVEVSEIVKRHGGGGHAATAGWTQE